MAKLSPTMLDVLRHAEQEPLIRLPGGFWTTSSTPIEDKVYAKVPAWSVGTQTIRALEQRGLLEPRGDEPEWKRPRIITDAGRVALSGLSNK